MNELEITSKYARRIVNNIKNLALRSRNIFRTEIKEFKQDEIAEDNLQQLEIIDDTKHPINQNDIINEEIIGDNVPDTKYAMNQDAINDNAWKTIGDPKHPTNQDTTNEEKNDDFPDIIGIINSDSTTFSEDTHSQRSNSLPDITKISARRLEKMPANSFINPLTHDLRINSTLKTHQIPSKKAIFNKFRESFINAKARHTTTTSDSKRHSDTSEAQNIASSSRPSKTNSDSLKSITNVTVIKDRLLSTYSKRRRNAIVEGSNAASTLNTFIVESEQNNKVGETSRNAKTNKENLGTIYQKALPTASINYCHSTSSVPICSPREKSLLTTSGLRSQLRRVPSVFRAKKIITDKINSNQT